MASYRRVLTALANGEPVEPADQTTAEWIIRLGGDPLALRHVLDSLTPTPAAELARITTPTLVLVGDQDHPHASAEALAAALPAARFAEVPGNHFTALTSPDLAKAILAFRDA